MMTANVNLLLRMHVGVLLVTLITVAQCVDLSRGWGDNIAWKGLDEGLILAAEQSRPLMLVIHKSWCGACKSLKPKFAESKEIAALSEQFVMVNVLDDEEPKEAKYAPDGGYIPRIFFLNSEGNVQNDVYNEAGSESYKYYYHDPKDIVASMRKVLGDKQQESKQEL